MQKFFRIPLIFFALSAAMGLLLRWHSVDPLGWITYPYWLHAHSHIMFLGWISNALYLIFVNNYVDDKWQARYRPLFLVMQAMLVGMVISFPMQGYGAFSIAFSTVHTICLVVFSFRLFADLRGKPASASIWHTKASLAFFLISAVGPFAIAATGMLGLAQTQWYYFAVYYYLHFQYNGFFTFGALALFFHLLESRAVPFSKEDAKLAGWFLAIACVPAYFLSTLWADPGEFFNAIGFVAGLLQIAFLLFFRRMVRHAGSSLREHLGNTPMRMLVLVLAAFITKVMLQLLSSHGDIALLAGSNRSFVMAYLHLVLIGVISLTLVSWYYLAGMLGKTSLFAVVLIITGFFLTEILLVLMPSWTKLNLTGIADPVLAMFLSSVVLSLGVFLLALAFQKPDKLRMKS